MGRKYKLLTDHKLLLFIFHPQKGIHEVASYIEYNDGPLHSIMYMVVSAVVALFHVSLAICYKSNN